MPGVRYFSFAGKLEDIGDTSFSPYLLSPFWAVHALYAMKPFEVGPNDGLVPVASAKEPFDNSGWIYVGEIVGKKVLPGTGIESKLLGIYWGIDHGAFMNFPFGTTGLFHFDGLAFFVDLARMLDAYSI
jgi:triacylglycerol esterase/lipase EstA (alpha/beta hydrolase family)